VVNGNYKKKIFFAFPFPPAKGRSKIAFIRLSRREKKYWEIDYGSLSQCIRNSSM